MNSEQQTTEQRYLGGLHRPVNFDQRRARIAIGIGVTFLIWLLLTLRLKHRCALGYKWFELYSPIVIGLLSACCIVFVRRLWLGVVVAVAIAIAFFELVIPPYLAWIHGPNRPRFPATEKQTAVLEDLQLIDPATPEALDIEQTIPKQDNVGSR